MYYPLEKNKELCTFPKSILMVRSLVKHHKQTLIYGVFLAGILSLLKWIEIRFTILNHDLETYTGAVALVFTCLGIWLALKLFKPSIQTTEIKEKEIPSPTLVNGINKEEIEKCGISSRELEVLALMAKGLSNQEIATSLFVSINTVKTHSSRIFEKLEVNRRTQAVEKAKRLHIIL